MGLYTQQFFKALVVLLLFLVFVLVFGCKSYEKYKQGGTTFNSRPIKNEAIRAPAITICPKNQVTQIGWKGNESMAMNTKANKLLGVFCKNATNAEDVSACIWTKTYSFDEAVARFVNGGKAINETFWAEDATLMQYGRCYTLNNTIVLESDFETSMYLFLNKTLRYTIVIHDPNFYFLAVNPLTISQIRMFLEPADGFRMVYIQGINQVRLNQANRPCKDSHDYSFTACLKNSLSRKLGCRLSWDSWSNAKIPKCTEKDEVENYENEWYQLAFMEQKKLIEYTNCDLPCRYREFKIVGKPIDLPSQNYGITLIFADTEIMESREEEFYSLSTFIAETGGALGLFLGFSFIALWDFVEQIWTKMKGIWT